jgi:hypothetical protein
MKVMILHWCLINYFNLTLFLNTLCLAKVRILHRQLTKNFKPFFKTLCAGKVMILPQQLIKHSKLFLNWVIKCNQKKTCKNHKKSQKEKVLYKILMFNPKNGRNRKMKLHNIQN